MGEPSYINTGVLQQNPFPGIRPFTSAEDKYFFGREEVVKEVLDLLFKHRFVALVGASGTGKTSLIQSGIIPELLNDDSIEWVPVVIRPGPSPLESLIYGFQKVFPKKISDSDVRAFLSGSQDLSALLTEKGLGSHHYYVVIDQFEELFREGLSPRKKKKNGRNPDAVKFVDLLIGSMSAERPQISLMISVRSDFIDACSAFRSLTEQMNKSKYLLPQMSRDSLAQAILGPVRQSGAKTEPGFEDYLLDDLDDVEMKLPMLQHALMRTWDYWIQKGELDQSITISDYQAVGTLRNAVSIHLDEAFEELDQSQKVICERLFKSITYKSDQLDSYRRRISIGNVARIAQCGIDEVVDVVEVFRKPGRAFLLPPAGDPLTQESQVELSHESLMKIWGRLKAWVEEESASVQMYLRLSEASALYQQGRTELWKPPDLQLALAWKEEENPTPAWGVQYDPAFERAMVFLNTSEEDHIWEEERKVIKQRRKLLLNRSIAILMVLLVIVMSVVFLGSRNRDTASTDADQMAGEDYTYTPDEQVIDPYVPEEEGAQQFADDNARDLDNLEAENPATQDDPLNSQVQEEMTDREQTVIPQQELSNIDTREEQDAGEADSRNERSMLEYRQQMVTLARDVSRQTLAISQDPDLQGLLAYQAYRFNAENGGTYYDNDIYNGLYAALKKLISSAYNIYPNMRSSVKDIEWLSRTGSFLTVSSDGSVKILSGNLASSASQINLSGTGLNNECLVVSPDERVAAIGTNGGGLLFVELENQGAVVNRNTEEGSIVLFLDNLGNSGSFVSAGTENRILKWEYGTFQSSTLVSTAARPSSLAGSADGRRVAYGTRDGGLFELDVQSPGSVNEISNFGRNQVSALKYSPGGQYLVTGHLDGTLRVLSGSGRQVIATLRGPGARVTSIDYSSDGRFLVAASHDGSVYLWSTSDWSNPPLIFTENNGFVLSVCFSGNGGYFYSGSVDYPRLVGRPTESGQMVNDFCDLVTRNLTREEWNQYFGEEIPYVRTCPDQN